MGVWRRLAGFKEPRSMGMTGYLITFDPESGDFFTSRLSDQEPTREQKNQATAWVIGELRYAGYAVRDPLEIRDALWASTRVPIS